jgi:hypothetical protein
VFIGDVFEWGNVSTNQLEFRALSGCADDLMELDRVCPELPNNLGAFLYDVQSFTFKELILSSIVVPLKCKTHLPQWPTMVAVKQKNNSQDLESKL